MERAPQGALFCLWSCSQKQKGRPEASFDHNGRISRLPEPRTGCRRPDRWRGVRLPRPPEPARASIGDERPNSPPLLPPPPEPARRNSRIRRPIRRRPGGHPASVSSPRKRWSTTSTASLSTPGLVGVFARSAARPRHRPSSPSSDTARRSSPRFSLKITTFATRCAPCARRWPCRARFPRWRR